MEVSEQIIQVLDAVCERLGIVVDWSQKNVLTYAQDLMRRIVLFEVLTSLMWIVVCVVVVFFAIKLIKKVIKLHKEGDCLIEFEELDRCACLVAGIVSAILCIAAVSEVFDCITYIAMPEMALVDFAKSLMGGG